MKSATAGPQDTHSDPHLNSCCSASPFRCMPPLLRCHPLTSWTPSPPRSTRASTPFRSPKTIPTPRASPSSSPGSPATTTPATSATWSPPHPPTPTRPAPKTPARPTGSPAKPSSTWKPAPIHPARLRPRRPPSRLHPAPLQRRSQLDQRVHHHHRQLPLTQMSLASYREFLKAPSPASWNIIPACK